MGSKLGYNRATSDQMAAAVEINTGEWNNAETKLRVSNFVQHRIRNINLIIKPF